MIFTKYQLAEAVILLEYSLVVLILVATFFLHFIFSKKSKFKKKLKHNLEQYLKQKVSSNELLVISDFPRKWKKIDILFDVVFRLDKIMMKDVCWETIRSSLLHSILIPMARVASNAKDWLSRFYAVQVFGLYSDQEDEHRISNLLNDPIPLVRLNAVNAAILNGSTKLMMTVVEHIAQERSLAQSIYLKVFDDVPTSAYKLVIKCLTQQPPKDDYLRATYYKILLKDPNLSFKLDLKSDTHSNNMELKLASIRLFSREGKAAVPILKEMLKDEQWQVQAVALHCLKDIHAIEAIDDITQCLQDANWWVRLVAAQTLSDLGEKGLLVLQTQDVKKDRFAFDVSKHVLEMLGVDV